MEHPRTREHDSHEDDACPWIDGSGNRPIQSGLAVSTDEPENGTNEVEFESLAERHHVSYPANKSMNGDIEPTSNGILWRVFPCLKSVTMAEIVRGLPVVEYLITILNRRVKSSEDVHSSKE